MPFSKNITKELMAKYICVDVVVVACVDHVCFSRQCCIEALSLQPKVAALCCTDVFFLLFVFLLRFGVSSFLNKNNTRLWIFLANKKCNRCYDLNPECQCSN